jgi:integrase/recombinase XerD
MATVYKRGTTWWVRYSRGGREVRKSAHTTVKATALAYLRQLVEEEGHLARGGAPPRRIREALDRFAAEHLPGLRSAKSYRLSIDNVLKPILGDMLIEELTRQHLVDLIGTRRMDGVGASTVRRDLACLSSVLTLAVGWGWAAHNVVRLLDRRLLGPTKSRRRYLSHDEERLLLAAAAPRVRETIIFAIETGLRRGEQLSLRWDQVDFDRCELRLLVTKTGVPRIVPLSDRALTVLRSLPRNLASNFVFVNPTTGTRYVDPSGGLEAAARRARIDDLRWHDLRRTCGCRLIQDCGADLYHVSRWLGHSSTQMTEKAYAFLRVRDLHGVIRPDARSPTRSGSLLDGTVRTLQQPRPDPHDDHRAL